MKITIFDMDDLKNPHWSGGQARVTREIGKRLAIGNEVIVYCSKYPNSYDYKEVGISYKHIGLGSNMPKLNNIIYILSYPLVARKIQADIILENFTAPFSVSYLPLVTKIPVVGVSSFFFSKELSRKYKINFYMITKLGIKLYRHIIVLNPDQKKEIEEINKNIHIELIPNGVDIRNFNAETSEKGYFVFLGRIDIDQKGLDLLLQSISIIKDQLDDKLYIIGYGSQKEENSLREMIKNNKLEQCVKILGKKVGRDKNKLLEQAKFIVCPSRYESFGLTVIEALSFGKPVICFNIKGLNWLPSQTSLKVKSFDIKIFADKILLLSRDYKLRERLGEKARQYSKRYSWDKSTEKYQRFLHNVYIGKYGI